MEYYVYRVTDPSTGEYYIGSRSCRCSISDDPYMGSMSTWKPDKRKLVKLVLRSDFQTRADAMQFEIETISNCIKDPLNRNYHIPNLGFSSWGRRGVNSNTIWMHDPLDDVNRRVPLELVEDYRQRGWNLGRKPMRPRTTVSRNRGKVNVVDASGKNFRVSTDDPRIASNELRLTQQGRVWICDATRTMSKLVPREEVSAYEQIGWRVGRTTWKWHAGPTVDGRKRMSEAAKARWEKYRAAHGV